MYKDIIKTIRDLRWTSLSEHDLRSVMILSGCTAKEFAKSFEIALRLYPSSINIRKVAAEELQTQNLQFEDYSGLGDHADFLWHFIRKIHDVCPYNVVEAGVQYCMTVDNLPAQIRAMSIFSRERELPRIFAQIIKDDNLSAAGLTAYRYYLERHIFLDSRKGGHADMLARFKVDESVAAFWEARLDMYRCIPMLFR